MNVKLDYNYWFEILSKSHPLYIYSPPPFKKIKFRGFKEDPFIFLSADDPLWPPITKYFKLEEGFPVNQLMVRCDEGKRRHIYFTSAVIKKLVQYNEDRIRVCGDFIGMVWV